MIKQLPPLKVPTGVKYVQQNNNRQGWTVRLLQFSTTKVQKLHSSFIPTPWVQILDHKAAISLLLMSHSQSCQSKHPGIVDIIDWTKTTMGKGR
jgi:hypothetical protein